MANKKQIAILKQGVEAWNQWREKNPAIRPDLGEADLFGANLSGANLHGADLFGANLSEANLHGADLSGADLSGADLRSAKLSEANLIKANLIEADLSRANLSEANLSEIYCSFTIFGGVDLSQAKGLETVKHEAPSTISIDTIYYSNGNIPEVFLRGAGVPDTFITFMKSLTSQAIDFYSCFISHSSKDTAFAERLYADLQSNGVRCWYAPHDMEIGAPILNEIDKAIRVHDKMLLILSENSVSSRWVEHEVLSATTKEFQQERDKRTLFPVRLDSAVMDTGVQWARNLKDTRHIADFTGWKDHDSYKKAFDKLLRDLKGKQ